MLSITTLRSRLTAGNARRWVSLGAAMASLAAVATVATVVDHSPRRADAVVPACGSGGTPSVNALQNSHFSVDVSLTPALLTNYAGYQVRAGASKLDNVWLKLSNFTGGVIDVAPNEVPQRRVPTLEPGASASEYLLLAATGATVAPQTHTITLYQGEPTSGTAICSRTFTYSEVRDTIKALANKVRTLTVSNPAGTFHVGETITATVTGDTGTIGAGPSNDPGVIDITPTSFATFPSKAWQFVGAKFTISPDGVAPAQTYTDVLHLSAASGPNRPYTVEYTFKAVEPWATPTSLKPIQYIASGTQVKHTDLASQPIISLPQITTDATVTLGHSVSPSTFGGSGGRASYVVSITNAGATDATLDQLQITPPSGTTYQVGTAQYQAAPTTAPVVSGTDLVFSGPFVVPAGTTTELHYDLNIPGSPGGARVSYARGFILSSQIDTTANTTDDAPATATVQVITAGSPTAVNDATSTPAATAKNIAVLTNDSTPTGTSLTVTGTSTPGHGRTSVLSDNTVTYTPDAGFSGIDTFTYAIDNGYGTAQATVTVTVGPDAVADYYGRPADGTTVTFPTVLTNDSCTGCTVSLVTNVSNGTLVLNSNGTFTYASQSNNWRGTVTFTYRATDPATGLTADAIATIVVGDATPDYVSTPYQTPISINVIANDFCGGCNNMNVQTQPTNGTATRTSTTNISYSPANGFWGIDSFNYSVISNGSTTAPVHVIVAPPTTNAYTIVDRPKSGTLPTSTSCSGCEYSLDTPPAHGTITINPDGTYTYTPDPGWTGTDTITYRITDPATGLTTTATLSVVVSPAGVAPDTATVNPWQTVSIPVLTNDPCRTAVSCGIASITQPSVGTATVNGTSITYTAPSNTSGVVTFTYRTTVTDEVATVTVTILPDAADDAVSTITGAAKTFEVRGNDACGDCTVTSHTAPINGSITVNADGTLTYTPNPGFSGTDLFQYTVTDSANHTATANVTITVAAPPSLANDSASTNALTPVAIDVRANDPCTTCTMSIGTDPTHGTLSLRADGSIQYSPNPGFTGNDVFTYVLTDPVTGLSSTATVTVRVDPVAKPDTANTPVGQPVTIDAAANDTCTSCTIAPSTQPQHGTATESGGRLVYTPDPAYIGPDSFTYTITDPATGRTATGTVTVNVSNAAPDTATTPYQTPVTIDVRANDTCTTCTIAATNPAHGTTQITAGNQVTYTPDNLFFGLDTFTYTATGSGNPATATVTVLVAPPARAVSTPINTIRSGNLLQGGSCSGCTFSVVAPAPQNGEISLNTDGTYSYTPPTGFSGHDQLQYSITDPVSGLVVEGVLDIWVGQAAPGTLSVSGQVSPSTFSSAGDTATFTWTVANPTGTIVDAISVTDALATTISCVPAMPFTLDLGESAQCTGTYTATGADVTAATIVDNATATGSSGAPVTATSPDVTVGYLAPPPPPTTVPPTTTAAPTTAAPTTAAPTTAAPTTAAPTTAAPTTAAPTTAAPTTVPPTTAAPTTAAPTTTRATTTTNTVLVTPFTTTTQAPATTSVAPSTSLAVVPAGASTTTAPAAASSTLPAGTVTVSVDSPKRDTTAGTVDWVVRATNNGTTPVAGPVKVTFNLPTGTTLGPVGITKADGTPLNGWTCSATSTQMECISLDPIVAGEQVLFTMRTQGAAGAGQSLDATLSSSSATVSGSGQTTSAAATLRPSFTGSAAQQLFAWAITLLLLGAGAWVGVRNRRRVG